MNLDKHLPVSPGISRETEFHARHNLSPEELLEIETAMVTEIREIHGERVSVAWISPDHPYANLVRTYEVEKFPEAADVDLAYDSNQLYLTIVDTRPGSSAIVHAASIMRSRLIDPSQVQDDSQDKTGIYTIDSLIGFGNFTAREFVQYYSESGVDLQKSVAVETNFKIKDKFEPFDGLGSADLTYLALFNMLLENGAPIGSTVVFATINTPQIKSLKRVGIDVEPLLNRDDFKTEEEELGIYSMPVAIQVNQNTADIFQVLEPLPEVIF